MSPNASKHLILLFLLFTLKMRLQWTLLMLVMHLVLILALLILPSLALNLLSVGQLCDLGLTVVFSSSG